MRAWRLLYTPWYLFTTFSYVKKQNLELTELSLQRGIFVAGLKEEIVNNADQVLKLIQQGEGWKENMNEDFGLNLVSLNLNAHPYL